MRTCVCVQKHSKPAAVYNEEQCVRKRTGVTGVGPLNVREVNLIWRQAALFAADAQRDWLL